MMKCPHCGGRIFGDDDVELLRRWCEESHIKVAPDGTVRRWDVGRLLRRSEHTLRNWASKGEGPEFVKLNGRCRYPLKDLAEWFRKTRGENYIARLFGL